MTKSPSEAFNGIANIVISKDFYRFLQETKEAVQYTLVHQFEQDSNIEIRPPKKTGHDIVANRSCTFVNKALNPKSQIQFDVGIVDDNMYFAGFYDHDVQDERILMVSEKENFLEFVNKISTQLSTPGNVSHTYNTDLDDGPKR